jgi:hypothetical protein
MLYSLFFGYENENIKKGALTMELPMNLWPEWLLQTLLHTLFMFSNPTPWMFLSTMEQVQ